MDEAIVDAPDCEVCRDTGWQLVSKEGQEFVRRCACVRGKHRDALFEKAGIPDRYQDCTFDGFELWNDDDPSQKGILRKMREFVDLWPEVDKGLLLMGPVGTGKTHLAVAALAELIRGKGVAGKFQDFTALALDIKMTFDTPGAQRALVEPLISTPLLVLDELGAGKVTPWVMDLLYYIVNSRYVENRRTIFTTNFRDRAEGLEETLKDRVSERIRSRLFEMCDLVPFYGKDFREHRLNRRNSW